MEWRAIDWQVWVGFAISAVAAWLLSDEGLVWFVCAVGTGVIQLNAVRIYQTGPQSSLCTAAVTKLYLQRKTSLRC